MKDEDVLKKLEHLDGILATRDKNASQVSWRPSSNAREDFRTRGIRAKQIYKDRLVAENQKQKEVFSELKEKVARNRETIRDYKARLSQLRNCVDSSSVGEISMLYGGS